MNSVFFYKRSCFKVLPSLLHCRDFLLLHQVEERKGEDRDGGNDCRVLIVQETGWCNMSVVMMSQSQHTICCDRASLSEEIKRAPAPTWFVHLVSGAQSSSDPEA